uniref:uncharacterized protein isoform X1 n=2 Tax=Myxine glutinosa TaxID=7769 RepID=UPI00358DFCB3
MNRDRSSEDLKIHPPGSVRGNMVGPGGSPAERRSGVGEHEDKVSVPDLIVKVKVESEFVDVFASQVEGIDRTMKVDPELVDSPMKGKGHRVKKECFQSDIFETSQEVLSSVKEEPRDSPNEEASDAALMQEGLCYCDLELSPSLKLTINESRPDEQPDDVCTLPASSKKESTDTPPGGLTCLVHGVDTSAATMPMKDNIWAMIQQAASNRKLQRSFAKSKYHRIICSLPPTYGNTHGYHVACYKNFTAVSKHKQEPCKERSKYLQLSSPVQTANTSGIFPQVCLFCGQRQLSRGRHSKESLGSCETLEAENSIRKAATALEDNRLLSKITGVQLVAKEVKYHPSCKSKYLKSANRWTKTTIQDESGASSEALKAIILYVQESVIEGCRPELLTSIYFRYQELSNDSGETPIMTAQLLGNILVKEFSGRIKFDTPTSKKAGVVVYSAETAEEPVRIAFDLKSTPEGAITQTALLLRKALKGVQKTKLPDPLSANGLIRGEAVPPDLVTTFFKVLYGGPNLSNHSLEVKQHADSSSQDALFIVRKGQVKPQKHLALGMSIKSLTGSRKLLAVLNRFGHSINYHCAEELETEIAQSQHESSSVCLEGTKPNLPTGLAFDNYDELACTLSGADTLHYNTGISYQVESTSEAIGEQETPVPIIQSPNVVNSRKRKLDALETPVVP